jgi:urea carboxylase
MSLLAYFKAIAMTRALAERRLAGIIDICSANASFQVLFDPDEVHPRALREIVEQIEDGVGDITSYSFDTRVIEVPVLYDDPWTNETLLRFRDRHQEPGMTDLEYGAKVNGFDSAEAFIAAHHGSPWFTSMVGFVAGLPFLYQMVERERQLQVPKYPSTCVPAPTRRRSRSGTAAASGASTRCAAPGAIRCSASHRCRSTTRASSTPASTAS